MRDVVAELARRQEGGTQKVVGDRKRKERVEAPHVLLPKPLPFQSTHLSETQRATFGTHPCHQRNINTTTTPPLRSS